LSRVVELQISVNQLILFSKLDTATYLKNVENLIIVDESPNISDRKNVEEDLVRFNIMLKLKNAMGNRVNLECPVFIKSMKNARNMNTTILTRPKSTTPKSSTLKSATRKSTTPKNTTPKNTTRKSTTSKSKKVSVLPEDL